MLGLWRQTWGKSSKPMLEAREPIWIGIYAGQML